MCTATFIKDATNRIIFTTNRDEHATRPTAPPDIHQVGDLKLLFPQDLQAGGSWISVSEEGLLCCLMNGAEGEQEWLGTEAEKSRGQVLLDAFQYEDAHTFMNENSFEKSHPFTLLHIHPNQTVVYAIKWNGSKKWIDAFDRSDPTIWSAYTLYPQQQRERRSKQFHLWAKDKNKRNAKDILTMHTKKEAENGLLLEGNESVNTISVTQVIIDQHTCSMSYREIGSDTVIKKQLTFR